MTTTTALITGEIKAVRTADDLAFYNRLQGTSQGYEPEYARYKYTAVLVLRHVRQRAVYVPLYSSGPAKPSSLGEYVSIVVESALIALDGSAPGDTIAKAADAPANALAADVVQAERVRDWLGPELWAACRAVRGLSKGRLLDDFVKALCAPEWTTFQ